MFPWISIASSCDYTIFVIMAHRMELAALVDDLAHELGGWISIHDRHGVTEQVPGLGVRPEQRYHHGPYCRYAKASGHQQDCAAAKARSLSHVADGRAREGRCPFGLWERVEPLIHNGELLGALYLGGFRHGAAPSTLADPPPAVPRLDAVRKAAVRRAADLLRELILLRLRTWERSGHHLGKRRSPEWYLELVDRLIAERFHLPLSRDELARELGLSADHLTRLLKRHRGCGFSELLQRARMERARALLRTGSRSVAEVARACGYADPDYFSAAFTRREGMSPRAFMRAKR